MPAIRYSKFFALVASLLLIVACSSTIRTKVNTFRLDGASFGRGSIKVVTPVQGAEESLEYTYYAAHLGDVLKRLGYSLVESNEASEFVAFLNYSIHESETEGFDPFYSRLFASSRSGSLGSSRSVGGGVIVVENSRSRLLYERKLQLVIAQSGEARKRVYEVTGLSHGQCGTLSVVFDEMLEAMLIDFPAGNGSLKSHSVRGDANC